MSTPTPANLAPTHPPARRRFLPLLLLIALAHALLAFVFVRGHAATFDEPVHLVAAAYAARGEFHLNPEHPPLWKLLPGLTQPPPPTLPPEVAGNPVAQWPLAVTQLYRSGLDSDSLLLRGRLAMLVHPLGVVVLAGLLVRTLAGPSAGLLAALLLAADPLLLAHGPLITNDVPLTLALLAVVAGAIHLRAAITARPTASALNRADLTRALLLGGLIGLSACIKFTAVPLAPLLAALILISPSRPLSLAYAARQAARAALLLLVALVFAYFTLWAVYGFRYRPAPDASPIDLSPLVERIAHTRRLAGAPDNASASPDLTTRALLAVDRLHLLPNAFVAGLLTSYAVTRSNPAFLFGQLSLTGWPWYFPAALLVKTPLGLLAAYTYLVVALPRATAPRAARGLAALGLLVLGVSAFSSLNIGVRHVLPAVALLTLATAIVLSRTPRLAIGLVVAVVLEVALQAPHALAFFNAPAQAIGPHRLLADSNLDWGQDLTRLARWHRDAGRPRLLVAYWGTADPAHYGLAGPGVVHLPNTYPYLPQQPPPPPRPDQPAFLAVSVSYLQGIQSGEIAPFFARLREHHTPVARVGRSIYLYAW